MAMDHQSSGEFNGCVPVSATMLLDGLPAKALPEGTGGVVEIVGCRVVRHRGFGFGFFKVIHVGVKYFFLK